MLNKIHQKLIDAYWAAFYSNNPDKAWVTNAELSAIQLRYSARIHELRQADIDVETESDGGNGFRYRLITNPDKINWETFEAKISERPIRRAPRKQVTVNIKQENLFKG